MALLVRGRRSIYCLYPAVPFTPHSRWNSPVDRIVRAGAIVPEYIGLVAVGCGLSGSRPLSHLALRVYRPRLHSGQRRGARHDFVGRCRDVGSTVAVRDYRLVVSIPSQQPQYVQQSDCCGTKSCWTKRAGRGDEALSSVAVVTVIAVTVPGLISSSAARPFCSCHDSAAADHDGFRRSRDGVSRNELAERRWMPTRRPLPLAEAVLTRFSPGAQRRRRHRGLGVYRLVPQQKDVVDFRDQS